MKEIKKEKPLSWLMFLGVMLCAFAPFVATFVNLQFLPSTTPNIVYQNPDYPLTMDLGWQGDIIGFSVLMLGLTIVYYGLKKWKN